MQSVLGAAPGSAAALINELGLVLYIGATLIFLLVMTLLLLAVFRRGERRVNAARWVIGGGIVFPAITLSALLVYSLLLSARLGAPAAGAEAQRVTVIGKRWWWDVRYHTAAGEIVLANELRVPVGEPVALELESDDVIHSFWVPSLAGKVDMIPGRTNRLVIRADEPGVFRGQCAEYCGGQHALMAFYVVAEPPAQFREWLAREAQPASVPTDPFLRLGYDMFFRGECHECHAIRGTPAYKRLGPDLTHIGSRRSLGAGVLRNHVGTMGGWIAGTQDLKPGSLMPSMNVYSGRELRALSAWLESLK